MNPVSYCAAILEFHRERQRSLCDPVPPLSRASFPLGFGERKVGRDSVAKRPISAGIFVKADRDILLSDTGPVGKQRGSARIERRLLFIGAAGGEENLHEQDSVCASDVEIRVVINEAPATVLRDDLELIALGHAEAFDHGSMNGVANRGKLFVGTTLEDIDTNKRHNR